MTDTSSRIQRTLTRGPIVVDELRASQYQKTGTITAILKQEVTVKSVYPGVSISNSHQDNVFGMDDFENVGEQEYSNVEIRTAFINVPEHVTLEAVQAKINAMPKACLYRVLSNTPIMTDDTKRAIERGLVTKDTLANSQAVRYPDDHAEYPGQLILDQNGNPQYRKVFFKTTATEDQDVRNPENVYMSPEIQQELEDGTDMQVTAETHAEEQQV